MIFNTIYLNFELVQIMQYVQTVKIYTTIIQICITPGTFPDLISLTRPKRVLSSGREGQGLATQPATRAPPERTDTLLVQGLTRPFTGTLFP